MLLFLGGLLFALVHSDKGTSGKSEYMSIDELTDKNIGVMMGSVYEGFIEKNMPGAQISFFDKASDMAAAVSIGKIDSFVCSEVQAKRLIAENDGLKILSGSAGRLEVAFAFPKTDSGKELCEKFNEFLSDIGKDGTLDTIHDKWFTANSSQEIDMPEQSGINGTLRMATTGTTEPYSYVADGKYAGLDIELACRFCEEYGYDLEIDLMDFGALVPALASSKYDLAGANITVTAERAESVYFSDSYTYNYIAFVVKGKNTVTENTPLSYFADKKIGILTGSSFEPITLEKFPDSEYLYFNTYSDMNLALLKHRIDGYISDEPTAIATHTGNSAISYLDEKIGPDSYYFLFGKTETRSRTLLKQFNEMLAGMEADGTLAELHNIWLGEDTSRQIIDMTGLTGENGTVNVGTCSFAPPFNMVVNGELSGLTIDLAYRFARKYGYDLQFEDTDISGMLSGLAAGKYDMLASPFSKTPEREESADFSEAFYSANIRFVVRTEDTSTGAKTTLFPAVTLEELDSPDRSVGFVTGTVAMFAAEEYLPNAEKVHFSEPLGPYEAVREGVIDAYIYDRVQMQLALDNGLQGVMLLDDDLGGGTDIASGISRVTKIPGLRDKMNSFLSEARADGTLEDIFGRWTTERNYTMPDIPAAASPEFTLVVGTSGVVEPYSFYKDNELTGSDIELARRFALWLNADIEFKVIDYSGIVAAAQSGEIDCIFANLNVTDERREAIDFSDTLYTLKNAVMVRAVSAQETVSEQSWFDSIVSSFEKNFIREDRWKLILDGIAMTCFITLLAAIFGSVIAFLVCMFRRTGSRLANVISNIYVKLLQGTPIVVLLMILYYVILGRSGLEAGWVAVIGFSLNFGAYASEIMRSGIESIDGGQREAALALGYSEDQAFFGFIFPQAAVRFLPVYRGEIVSLLKSTSIVGYIAIQDLTKKSDIIRSRTYEAFFPLIATAIIYFILAWIISLILKIILNAIDKRHRKGGAAK